MRFHPLAIIAAVISVAVATESIPQYRSHDSLAPRRPSLNRKSSDDALFPRSAKVTAYHLEGKSATDMTEYWGRERPPSKLAAETKHDASTQTTKISPPPKTPPPDQSKEKPPPSRKGRTFFRRKKSPRLSGQKSASQSTLNLLSQHEPGKQSGRGRDSQDNSEVGDCSSPKCEVTPRVWRWMKKRVSLKKDSKGNMENFIVPRSLRPRAPDLWRRRVMEDLPRLDTRGNKLVKVETSTVQGPYSTQAHGTSKQEGSIKSLLNKLPGFKRKKEDPVDNEETKSQHSESSSAKATGRASWFDLSSRRPGPPTTYNMLKWYNMPNGKPPRPRSR